MGKTKETAASKLFAGKTLPAGTVLRGCRTHNAGIRIRLITPVTVTGGGRIGGEFYLITPGPEFEKCPHKRAFARLIGESGGVKFTAATALQSLERYSLLAGTGRGGKETTPVHAFNLNCMEVESIPTKKGR